MKINSRTPRSILVILSCFIPALLYSHDSGNIAGGLGNGISHPFTGLDHVAAMVAVGIWGGQLKQPAIWLLPVTFPVVMAFGAMLGVMGAPLPGIEIGIALSAIVLGIMIAFKIVPALWIAALIVGIFAIFHGHAHGTELPGSVQPLAYGVGFVVGTGILHVSGISIGLVEKLKYGDTVVRVIGSVIGIIGTYFLFNALG